jgi:hypothetical protein
MITPRTWYAATAAMLALLVIAGADLAVMSGRSARPAALPTPNTPSTASPSRPRPLTATPVASPTSRPVPKLPADTVVLPAQHVRAPIGVCQIVQGGLEPPADVHRTCYWAGGAPVGAGTGTTVLTGHINYVGQGTGAFGNLARLHAGQLVYTSGADAKVTRWRIMRVRHRPKTKGVDPAAFAGRSGARRLYLISCGGAFDASELSYVDNIYVLATPVSA